MNEDLTLDPELQERLRAPFDPVLTDQNRLRIQAALVGLPAEGSIRFTELARILRMSDGNLGSHLAALTEHGYVQSEVTWQGRRRTRWYAATGAGRDAFADHVRGLRAVILAGEADADADRAEPPGR